MWWTLFLREYNFALTVLARNARKLIPRGIKVYYSIRSWQHLGKYFIKYTNNVANISFLGIQWYKMVLWCIKKRFQTSIEPIFMFAGWSIYCLNSEINISRLWSYDSRRLILFLYNHRCIYMYSCHRSWHSERSQHISASRSDWFLDKVFQINNWIKIVKLKLNLSVSQSVSQSIS